MRKAVKFRDLDIAEAFTFGGVDYVKVSDKKARGRKDKLFVIRMGPDTVCAHEVPVEDDKH